MSVVNIEKIYAAARMGALAALCAGASALHAGGFELAEPVARLEDGRALVELTGKTSADCSKAWAVFVDYEAMPKFMPGLESSRVASRAGGKIVVEQSGKASFGVFSRRYKSSREISLVAGSRIDSASLPGDDLPSSSKTEFEQAGGGGCRVAFATKVDIPEGVPEFAAQGVAKSIAKSQMSAMLAEVSRRASASAPSLVAVGDREQ
jgi:uncharacterized membrane protein